MKVFYLRTNGYSITELPTILEAEGYWCGVVEITGRMSYSKSEPVYLCSDICEESVVGNNKLPVLRRVKRDAQGIVKAAIHNIIWLEVTRPRITSIKLYLSNGEGDLISLKPHHLHCTLLIVPNKKKKNNNNG